MECFMTQLVTATFADHASGLAAAKDLTLNGFAEKDVRVVTKSTNFIAGAEGATDADDGLVVALVRDGVSRANAIAHANTVKGGSYFVSVRAQFGMARLAIAIMQRHEPEELHTYVATEPGGGFNDASPFSFAFGLPLLSGSMTPFSDFWNLPVLLTYVPPKWSAITAPFSDFFGAPVLKNHVTPRIKLLTGKAALLSESLGLPTLSNNPAPLSALLKAPLLARRFVSRARA
jgi:hypothetical protein